MGKMKELATILDELFVLLRSLVNDVHDIAEYVRKQEKADNRTIKKEARQWRKLI